MPGLSRTVLVFAAMACGSACGREAAPASEVAAQVPAPPPARTVPALPERQGRTLVDAKNLKLQELVQEADRIFRGRVVRIEEKSVTLEQAGDKAEARVRDVTLAVEDGIKNATPGQQLTVRQLISVSAALEEGEEVFWFLAKDSDLGLTQPLGVFSGDFRIIDGSAGKVVNNLRGNAGLWEGSLWTDDGFNRQEVLAAAKTMKLPAARVASIDKQGLQAPDNRPIPLDLLEAATKSQIRPR